LASVRSIDDALSITLNTNGRVLRNIISGADTVMSHILHFYHLSAPDFVNVSPATGILGSPWDDGQGGNAFGSTCNVKFLSLTAVNSIAGTSVGRKTGELVESYVMALNMRKTAHTLGAIFSGRQPMQNAIVPGGVSTLYTQSDIDACRDKLNGVRNFINRYYIPDVVFVATASQAPGEDWTKYWFVGTNPGKLLSYGEYPLAGAEAPFSKITDNNQMLICRGLANYVSAAAPPTFEVFDSANITEWVDYSFYSSPSNLHPSGGITTPDVDLVSSTTTQQYSWLKAPRYNGYAAEVGPLSRMVVTYLQNFTNSNTQTVTEYGSYTLGNIHTGLALGSTYDVETLVGAALNVVSTLAGTSVGVPQLFSPLGRHAARALECKVVADAMYSWLDELTLNEGTTSTANYTTTVSTGSGYVYKAIPKATVTGEGLAEAPRGALGHWIKIQGKKIANYQCVVPTTWNACPKGNGSVRGPAESALMGIDAGATAEDAIVNIARMMHPYDFCIACAVHVVNPKGKEIAKFKMDLDGKITRQ